MTRTISSAQARIRFADLLGRVAYGGDEFVITRKGKPLARLVPVGSVNRGADLEQKSPKWAGLDGNDAFFRTLDQIRKEPLRSKSRKR